MDYLEYAYLQQGKDTDARKFVDEVRRGTTVRRAELRRGVRARRHPRTLRARAARLAVRPPHFAFPTVKMPWHAVPLRPRRHGLRERNRGAAARDDPAARPTGAGVARGARRPSSRSSRPAGPYDWAGQVASMRLAAAGWSRSVRARPTRPCVCSPKPPRKRKPWASIPVTPGAILPARELLGDLLLELKRPAEALAAYERSLADAPKRFNSTRRRGARSRCRRSTRHRPQVLRGARRPLRPACARPEVKAAQTYVSRR